MLTSTPCSARSARQVFLPGALPAARHAGAYGRVAQRTTRAQAAGPESDVDLEDETMRKRRIAQELRAQEKFMKVGSGEADCIGCGYHYDPKVGDPEYPVNAGTKFRELPTDWKCPVCGAEKQQFQVQEKEIAGFAVNQGYGLGTNSMTSGQKSALIYGSLAFFFFLFLLGYFLE